MTTDDLSPVITAIVKSYEMASSWISADRLKELSTEELVYRPAEKRSHIYWLLGHIVATSDIAPYINGSESVVDKSYLGHFGTGTEPKDDPAEYPPVPEILENFEKVIDNSISALKSMGETETGLSPAKPLPEFLQPYFPTRLDLVIGHATHISYHGGQIGLILKALGK